MSEVFKHTPKLWERKPVPPDGGSYWLFWCPACGHGHGIPTPRWGFDGKVECPTFTPSLLIYHDNPETKQRITHCHLNVTAGQIVYHGDCPHEYKGRTIPMQDLPADYGF